jgi:hypothetical protein
VIEIEKYYTRKEVMQELGWSDFIMRTKDQAGYFPNATEKGKSRRFLGADVQAVKDNKVVLKQATTGDNKANTGVPSITPEVAEIINRKNKSVAEKEAIDAEKAVVESQRSLDEEKGLRSKPETLAEWEKELNDTSSALDKREEELTTIQASLLEQKSTLISWNTELSGKEKLLADREQGAVAKENIADTYDLAKRAEADKYYEDKVAELLKEIDNTESKCNTMIREANEKVDTINRTNEIEINKRIGLVNKWNETVNKMLLDVTRWHGLWLGSLSEKEITETVDNVEQWLKYLMRFTTTMQLKEYFKGENTRNDFLTVLKSAISIVKKTSANYSQYGLKLQKIPTLAEFTALQAVQLVQPQSETNANAMPTHNEPDANAMPTNKENELSEVQV